jgi:hypothetical protein
MVSGAIPERNQSGSDPLWFPSSTPKYETNVTKINLLYFLLLIVGAGFPRPIFLVMKHCSYYTNQIKIRAGKPRPYFSIYEPI